MKLALVVDRDAESIKLVRAVLEKSDFAVISAATIDKARDVLKAARPDVIMCDVGVPPVEALAFIRTLRGSADVKLNRIPAIATTVAYEDIDARTVRAAGFDVLLRKPLDPDHLPEIVALLVAASLSAAPRST